jgi:TatD DNase family protein
MSKYKYIDVHSHPQDVKYEGRADFLETLKESGGATIAIGTDYELSHQAIELARKHQNIWATIGIHPADNHAEVFEETRFEELLDLGKITPKTSLNKEGRNLVVGIGECGLDYFYFDKKFMGENRYAEIEEEKKRQRQIFIKQVEFAIKKDLPLVIHGRPAKNSMDAYRDILDILEKSTPTPSFDKVRGLRGHAHFFVGNLEIAKRFLDLGFLLSFDGPITFTTEYDEVIKFTPLDRLMIETDSPYAAPAPYRGQINYPYYVVEIAKKIAELKVVKTEEILEITRQNAEKLFRIEL